MIQRLCVCWLYSKPGQQYAQVIMVILLSKFGKLISILDLLLENFPHLCNSSHSFSVSWRASPGLLFEGQPLLHPKAHRLVLPWTTQRWRLLHRCCYVSIIGTLTFKGSHSVILKWVHLFIIFSKLSLKPVERRDSMLCSASGYKREKSKRMDNQCATS